MSLTSDAGAFTSLIREDVGVAAVLVAPAQVGVQGPGLDDVVGMVGVGQRELSQRSEVGCDGVGPGRVGWGEAQLDLVPVSPVSSSACTRRAMTGTVLPPAEASSIIARLNRTELVLPRRTIC